MSTTTLPPKLQQATDLIATAVTEANDAIVLAKADHERVLIDVRAAQARLEQINKEADQSKKTLVAVTEGIEKRTKAYKVRQAKAEATVLAAEKQAEEATEALDKALQQLETAKQAVKDAETAKADLDTKLGVLNGKIEAANTQLTAILNDIDTKTPDRDKLLEEVRKLESRQNTLVTEIEELETKKSDAQHTKDQELATVIATIKERRKELAKVEAKIKQFNDYMDRETKVLEAKKRLADREAADINNEKRKVQSDRSILSPLS